VATYSCVPSPVTVSPCPTGTAPTVEVVSVDPATPYAGKFDFLPLQDVLVAGVLALAFLLGLGVGRRA